MALVKAGGYLIRIERPQRSVSAQLVTNRVTITRPVTSVRITLPPIPQVAQATQPRTLTTVLSPVTQVKFLLSGPRGAQGETGPAGTKREVFITSVAGDLDTPDLPAELDQLVPAVIFNENPSDPDCVDLYYWEP